MNKIKKVLLTVVVLLIFTMLGLNIYLILNKEIVQTTNITKTEKEVTVTDQGIADSVDKLYDATVLVELTDGDSVTGWGSGFVYKTDDSNAYIITNYHVTEDNKKVTIEYTNGTTTQGTVIGGDEYTDVSIIKVNKDTILKVASIAESSSSLNLGDTVFAIGTPVSLSLKFTVTRGILSGKDRLIPMSSQSSSSIFSRSSATVESWYINLLQIDASINSGNSGGPLANANGEVVGITNSKLSSSTIENIGFAVPIEDVVNVAEQVINDGKVSRPYVGVGLTSISNAIRNNLIDETDEEGVVVGTVEDNSAAKNAGLKEGDIITKIGDYEVTSVEYFKYYLNRYKPNDKVVITYIRDGKSHETELTLGKKS
jgi:serine protease Do